MCRCLCARWRGENWPEPDVVVESGFPTAGLPAEALGLQAYSREDVDAQTAESKGLELRVWASLSFAHLCANMHACVFVWFEAVFEGW